ncbi:hypothetical protein MJT46_004769 [Ovis ammon polii x Ovis aries]|nr:hypothetical protein MJT46_004769 [Ovis ammon polii x Ovis aries]
MAASQVPHIHSEDSGTSMEQRRDPSKQALLKCQDNNFPPAAERQPLGSKHQDSIESAGLFVSYGPLEAHELMRAIGKILEEKLACRFESEALQLSQHKKELQTQVKPGKGHPSNYGAPPDLWQEEWLRELFTSLYLFIPFDFTNLKLLQRKKTWEFEDTDGSVTPESNFLGLPELMDMLNMLQRPENAFRQTDVGSSF